MMMIDYLLFLAPVATAAAGPLAPPPADSDKVVCHLENVGETRIAQRICHTKAEWAAIERQSEDDFSSTMSKNNNPENPADNPQENGRGR